MIDLWRRVWTGAEDTALFGIATLAAGGSEGPGWHMSGMRWSETGNFGSWNNPVMPNTFGAQVYDLGDPWSQVGDGNPRKLDQTTGKTIGLRCCGWSVNAQAVPPYTFPYWGNCSGTANGGACSDKYNCSLPEIGHDGDPIAGKYGSMCAAWDESAWSPSLRPLAALVRANNPSGLEGNNFMGGIHPRIKRPVGRRLAYSAARMLKKQAQHEAALAGTTVLDTDDGAMTGPTVSGCSYKASGALELKFNASLLGGEGLMLRSFDYNTSDYAPEPDWAGPGMMQDSLGMLVCAANASDPASGNATTCACSSWNYFKYNSSDPSNPGAWWYCEVGPGFKPTLATVEKERTERAILTKQKNDHVQLAAAAAAAGLELPPSPVGLGWVPQANPFQNQWYTTPLVSSADKSAVTVDLSKLKGLKPLAVRLAWVLFDAPDQSADTCCPGHIAQNGLGVCIPGNCPLYSAVSELPANPFYATILDGKCKCLSPQTCDA